MSGLFGGDYGWSTTPSEQVSQPMSPEWATNGATSKTAENCGFEAITKAGVASVASVALWNEGIERLSRARRPESIEPRAWNMLVADARMLAQLWGAEFAAHGWSTLDIFGVTPQPKGRRLDIIGLISLLHGRPVDAVDADTATIRNVRGAPNRFYRRLRAAGAVAVWEWG